MDMMFTYPADSLWAINMDHRKFNRGRSDAKQPVLVEGESTLKGKPDSYTPGVPFKLAPSLKGIIPVKPRKVQGVCVFANCTNKSPWKGKWCPGHAKFVRAISMKVNQRKHYAAGKRKYYPKDKG